MSHTASQKDVRHLVEMIGAIARLDFSYKIKTELSDDPMDVLAHGLNMLSEELEYKVSEKQRLEEINENLERFSFTVAHDLKSPILASNGLIDFMNDEMEENGQIPVPSLKEYLGILKDANTQTSKLINGILQYSRWENDRMKMSAISLADLCWQISKSYNPNEKVRIDYASELPTIVHNETALSQVLHNLITNAIKYCDKEFCKIKIEYKDLDSFHQISVIDNGPGLNEEERKIIFNLFENLRNASYESTGVGLAIAEKIVTKTGGKIWVENAIPHGAQFIFTIPQR